MTREYDLLLDLVRGRRSVRRFTEQPVSAELVDQMLEAARWAPSAGNRQGWRFLVVRSRERIERMAEAVRAETAAMLEGARPEAKHGLGGYLAQFDHFVSAPVVLVPIHREGIDLLGAAAQTRDGGDGMDRANVESIASVSAAIMNLLLAAHALGLGACWMTGPLIASTALEEVLAVPDGWRIAAVIPVGYAEEGPEIPSRRPIDRIRRVL